MTHLRWLAIPIALALIAAGGLATRAGAHRGYPRAVYYVETTLSGAGAMPPSTVTVETWVDPARVLARYRYQSATPGADQLLYQQGAREYTVRAGRVVRSDALRWPLVEYRRQFQELSDEFRALGTAWLAQARGPVVRVRFAGHRALRFVTPGDAAATRHIRWIDAGSHAPLQDQSLPRGGGALTYRYVRWARIAPGVLPVDFFDPPRLRATLWDRLIDWLRVRLART